MCKTKAPERNRTADLIVTNDVLYRLSYKSESSKTVTCL